MKPTRSAPAPDSLVARVRGWVGRPLGRAALVLAGLVVLSLVGRFAVAGGRVPPAPPSVVPSAIARAPLAVADSASVSAAASGSGSASAAVPPHAARATTDDPVYLNDATVDDLRRLPGIGPKRALAVLALRQRLGRFTSDRGSPARARHWPLHAPAPATARAARSSCVCRRRCAVTRGHRLAKPFDERADFGASQLVGRAIDDEHRRDGLHFRARLPARSAGASPRSRRGRR